MSARSQVPGWVCQSRDLDVLSELTHTRALTIRQIAQLHFDSREAAACKRIGVLRRAGLLSVTKDRTVADVAIVQITHAGYMFLRSRGWEMPLWPLIRRRQSLSGPMFRHELQIIDMKAALTHAIRSSEDSSLDIFLTSGRHLRQLCGGRSSFTATALRPDAYIALNTAGRTHHFFLELDRSTQATRIIRDKALAYRRLYRSGSFARAMGPSPTAPEQAPFRVLFVCQTSTRRDNLAGSLLTLVPPVRTQCVFATLEDVMHDALGAVWLTPHALARGSHDQRPPLVRLLP